MKNFNQLILKKILKEKMRLVLMSVNFSLGIFILCLLIGIGLNVVKNNNIALSKLDYYKLISVSINSSSNTDIDSFKSDDIQQMQVEMHSDFVVDTIGNLQLDSIFFATQINTRFDFVTYGENTIFGENLTTNEDVLLSEQFVNLTGLDKSLLVGSKVILTNGKQKVERTVVGIHNRDNNDKFSPLVVVRQFESDTEIERILLKAKAIDKVELVSNQLKQLNFEVDSYVDDIRRVGTVNFMTLVVFLFVSTVLIVSCAIILRTSMSVSIRSKYHFIAMLKTFGYSDAYLKKIIYLELGLVTIVSLIVGFVLYTISLVVLPHFLDTLSFYPIQYVSLFSFSFLGVFLSIVVAVFVCILNSIKPFMLLKQCDCFSLVGSGD